MDHDRDPVITCLDIARVTGVAWGHPGARPELDLWDLNGPVKNPTRATRAARLIKLMAAHIKQHGPSHVFIEEPLPAAVLVDIGATLDTQMALSGFAVVAEAVCESYGIPTALVDRQQVLKHFTGVARFKPVPMLDRFGKQKFRKNGEAMTESGAKIAVKQRCKLLGLDIRDNDNLADAAAIHDFVSFRDFPRMAVKFAVNRPVRISR